MRSKCFFPSSRKNGPEEMSKILGEFSPEVRRESFLFSMDGSSVVGQCCSVAVLLCGSAVVWQCCSAEVLWWGSAL